MDPKSSNPLARFEKRKTNYPLIIAAALLAGVLVVGIVFSARIQDWSAAWLFVSGLGLFVVVILLNTAMNRRLAAIDAWNLYLHSALHLETRQPHGR